MNKVFLNNSKAAQLWWFVFPLIIIRRIFLCSYCLGISAKFSALLFQIYLYYGFYFWGNPMLCLGFLAYLILVITICRFRVFLARASWKLPLWQTCDALLENHRSLIPSQNTWWSHVRYEGQWSGTPRDSQLLHSTCDLFHQRMAHRGPPLESIIEMFLNTGFTVLEFKKTN